MRSAAAARPRRPSSGPVPLPELPTVPGREVAGTVEALGPGTDPTWLGRRVVAHLGTAPVATPNSRWPPTTGCIRFPTGSTRARPSP